MAGRSYKTEAVVLRSFRLGEADRVLHLYTLERGRVGAVAKGIRRTKSRFGARLEPLSHVAAILHQGSGELHTVTGVDLVASHRAAREDPYRLGVGLVGLEAMLRLFTEEEGNRRAFDALTRFLEVLDEWPARPGGPGRPGAGRAAARPALDPLALAFQLKLLWLSGYLPHLSSCAECGSAGPFVGYSARAGGAVCDNCASESESLALSAAGLAAVDGLLRRPLDEAAGAVSSERAAREALGVVTASYEYHGGFRLRTLTA
jgi:DNA repair protein RecO (recombination protein O)